MIVDAHVHLWDAAHTPQPWMTSEHASIARPFDPSDLHPLLERNGIDAVVLVQGACLDSDTDYLLSEAVRHDSIAAVTAWLALDDPERARARLDELGAHRAFRAVRHLIHNEADPHWILRPAVLESLALLEERDVVLELPVVFPRHLARRSRPRGAISASCRSSIDHLGKPPIGRRRHDDVGARPAICSGIPQRAREALGPEHGDRPRDWRRRGSPAGMPGRARCLRAGSTDVRKRLARPAAERRLRPRLAMPRCGSSRRSPDATRATLLGENAARVYRFTDAPATTTSPAREDRMAAPLTDQAIAKIKELIISGEFTPGSKLPTRAGPGEAARALAELVARSGSRADARRGARCPRRRRHLRHESRLRPAPHGDGLRR